MNSLGADDMVFYKEGEKLMSGGFLVDSIMLQKGGAPMQTVQNDDENNDDEMNSMSSVFKNLAVPAGLLYQSGGSHSKRKIFKFDEYDEEIKDREVLPEKLHDILFRMIEVPSRNKKYTQKNKKNLKEKKHITKRNL